MKRASVAPYGAHIATRWSSPRVVEYKQRRESSPELNSHSPSLLKSSELTCAVWGVSTRAIPSQDGCAAPVACIMVFFRHVSVGPDDGATEAGP